MEGRILSKSSFAAVPAKESAKQKEREEKEKGLKEKWVGEALIWARDLQK